MNSKEEKNVIMDQLVEDVEPIKEELIETSDNVENKSSEPTEEELREMKINAVKNMHLRYNTKKHFGVKYHAEKQRKNKQAKRSRKINRRKK